MKKAKPILTGVAAVLLLAGNNASAKWLANIGAGETYNDNFSLQNGNYTNISQNRTTRTGTEFSGGVSWESFSNSGGYSIDLQGMLDRDNSNEQKLSNLTLIANRVQPLSIDWLLRFNGGLVNYEDEAYTANSYGGYSLGATLGYFGKQSSGVDITLNLDDEDHNQDANALYKLRRLGVKATYFFPTRPQSSQFNILAGVESVDSNDNRRDATSLLASINWEQIHFGKNQAILSLSWKRDTYAQSYTVTQSDQMSSYAPTKQNYKSSNYSSNNYNSGNGSYYNSGSSSSSSTQVRVDTQYYLTATVQRPFARSLRGSLSANAGYYSSDTGDQTFVNVYARLRWYIQ